MLTVAESGTTAGKFGPFAGQLFVGDQSGSIVTRVALEKVNGEVQGACFPFRRGFASGPNRMAFAPDGSLWVGQTDRGWGAIGGRPHGLERVAWTGRVPFEILRMSATPEGFDLTFTRPVNPEGAAAPAAWSLQRYHYLYHATYGSPQVDVTAVPVKDVRVSADGLRVSLVLPELVPGRIYELHAQGVRAADGARSSIRMRTTRSTPFPRDREVCAAETSTLHSGMIGVLCGQARRRGEVPVNRKRAVLSVPGRGALDPLSTP